MSVNIVLLGVGCIGKVYVKVVIFIDGVILVVVVDVFLDLV